MPEITAEVKFSNVVTERECAHCGQPEGEEHHGLCVDAVPPRRRMTAPVWAKGRQAAPGSKGTPYRHVHDQAILLLDGITADQLGAAVLIVIARDPRLALEALTEVTDLDKEETP